MTCATLVQQRLFSRRFPAPRGAMYRCYRVVIAWVFDHLQTRTASPDIFSPICVSISQPDLTTIGARHGRAWRPTPETADFPQRDRSDGGSNPDRAVALLHVLSRPGAGPHHHPVTRGRGERHNGFLTSWQDWDPVDLLGCIYHAPDVMPSTMDVRDSRSNRRRRSGSPVPLRRTHPALSRCGRGRG